MNRLIFPCVSRSLWAAAAAALVFLGCAPMKPLSNSYSKVTSPSGDRCASGSEGTCVLYEVSVIELIADPERWDGKKVRLVGFVNLEFERNQLCLLPGSHQTECIWLDIEGLKDPGFRRGQSLVEGIFDGKNKGHLGLYSGAIKTLDRFERWN